MSTLLRRLTVTALLGASLAAAQAQEIAFGVIATDAASTQRERWEPFFRDMEKKTGLTIKSYYAPDYAGVIEAMRFNKVQVAWYGNKSAMEAVDRAQRRGLRAGDVCRWQLRLQKPAHHAQRQPVLTVVGGRDEERQVAELRHRRSELHIGLSRSHFLPVLPEQASTTARPSRRRAMPATAPTSKPCWPSQIDVATNNTEEMDKLESQQARAGQPS